MPASHPSLPPFAPPPGTSQALLDDPDFPTHYAQFLEAVRIEGPAFVPDPERFTAWVEWVQAGQVGPNPYPEMG